MTTKITERKYWLIPEQFSGTFFRIIQEPIYRGNDLKSKQPVKVRRFFFIRLFMIFPGTNVSGDQWKHFLCFSCSSGFYQKKWKITDNGVISIRSLWQSLIQSLYKPFFRGCVMIKLKKNCKKYFHFQY